MCTLKRKGVCSFCLGWLSLFSLPLLHAQNNYIDSLRHELTNRLTDSNRISIYQELGYNLMETNSADARSYFIKAYNLAVKSKIDIAKGPSLGYVGMSYAFSSLFDSAIIYIDSAMTFFAGDTLPRARGNMASLISEKANIEKALGKYQSAIRHYLESNTLTEKYATRERDINLGIGYINIAAVFEEMKQYAKALEYNRKALSIFNRGEKKLNDPAYLNILRSRRSFSKLGMASDYINLKRFPEALALLNEEEPVILRLNNDDLTGYLYNVWGAYLLARNEFTPAIEAYKKTLKFSGQIGHRKLKALCELGRIYKQIGDLPNSKKYFVSALHEPRVAYKRKIKAEVLGELADIELLQRNYKMASVYYNDYVKLSDSLNEAETKRTINEIENQYQAKKKQDSILVLQKTNQLQQLALHKKKIQNIFLVTSLVLLLLIALLIYRNFRSRHRLLQQNELLQSRRIRELEKERQLVAAHAIMKGQEQERSRLARDLHDGVGGLLSGIKLSLSTMKGNVFLSEENVNVFNHILTQMDQSIGELRRVSHNMMPEALIKYGLKEALENYCENLNLSGKIKVQFQAYGTEQRMEQNTEIVLYRIVQELLNNVIKHADAKHVLIQLMREGDRFSLTVEDDGKGFDIQEAEKMNGAGLANIKARVEYLGGEVDFRSVPADGTSVNIEGKC